MKVLIIIFIIISVIQIIKNQSESIMIKNTITFKTMNTEKKKHHISFIINTTKIKLKLKSKTFLKYF